MPDSFYTCEKIVSIPEITSGTLTEISFGALKRQATHPSSMGM